MPFNYQLLIFQCTSSSQSAPSSPVQMMPQGNSPQRLVLKEKKESKLPLIIGVVAAFLVIAIVGGTVLIVGGKSRRLQGHLDLGNRYLSQMDYDQAIASFEDALSIDPKSVNAYLGLADAYVGKEDYVTAIDVLEEGYELTHDPLLSAEITRVENMALAAEQARIEEEERLLQEQQELEALEAQQTRDEMIAQYGLGYDEGMMIPDCTFTDANGNSYTLWSLLGNGPLYVNIFTTWCPYCFYEIPDMETIYAEYGEGSVIMIDLKETRAEVDAYVKQYGITIPIYYLDNNYFGNFFVEAIPVSFVLNEYGRIAGMNPGMAEYSWMKRAMERTSGGDW